MRCQRRSKTVPAQCLGRAWALLPKVAVAIESILFLHSGRLARCQILGGAHRQATAISGRLTTRTLERIDDGQAPSDGIENTNGS